MNTTRRNPMRRLLTTALILTALAFPAQAKRGDDTRVVKLERLTQSLAERVSELEAAARVQAEAHADTTKPAPPGVNIGATGVRLSWLPATQGKREVVEPDVWRFVFADAVVTVDVRRRGVPEAEAAPAKEEP